MPKTTLAGHPLHPQLISAPAALLPFSFVMDVMHAVTGKEVYAEVAYHTLVGGGVGGLAAALAGAGDYLEIPGGSRTKRIANRHAALNLGLLGLYGVNLLLRRGRTPPTGPVPMLLSALGTAGLAVSAWYGGELVYEQGVRVKGLSPIEGAPELAPPGDRAMTEALSQTVAAQGPRS